LALLNNFEDPTPSVTYRNRKRKQNFG